jgi:hypothetical protein
MTPFNHIGASAVKTNIKTIASFTTIVPERCYPFAGMLLQFWPPLVARSFGDRAFMEYSAIDA